MTQDEKRIYLINRLLQERAEYEFVAVPNQADKQKMLLRALMNIRPPQATDNEFLRVQDEYLQQEIQKKGITDIADLQPLQRDIYL